MMNGLLAERPRVARLRGHRVIKRRDLARWTKRLSTMLATQLVNSPSQCVDDSLDGLLASNPSVARLQGHRVIVRRDLARWRAAAGHRYRFSVVCGGGSGHEPAHGGLVGSGLLTAAVAGDVFASPPVSAVLAALRAAAAPDGVLLIIKNYTGDRLNFGLAAERARSEGIPVEMVVVGEDSALTGRDKSAGRRGLAGAVLIEKLAGAASEEGRRSLPEVATILRAVARQMATISVSLSPCVKPGGAASFHLPPDCMEIGVGIHGEAGVGRVPAVSADRAVTMMLDHMTSTDSPIRLQLAKKVALLVNNLGGLTDAELHVVTAAATAELRRRGAEVVRCRAGRLMTSLAMSGVSLTVLNLSGLDLPELEVPVTADQLLAWLDAPASAAGWRFSAVPCGSDTHVPREIYPPPLSLEETADDEIELPLGERGARCMSRCVEFTARALLACSGQMDRLESPSGDGDGGGGDGGGGDGSALYGTQMAALCRAVLEALPDLPTSRPVRLLDALSQLCERGSGQPAEEYSLALAAAAVGLRRAEPGDWVAALQRAVTFLRLCFPAGRPSALDALQPALEAAERTGSAQAAAEAAEAAALRTADSTGTGRPSAAAHAVGVGMRALAEARKLH